MTVQEIIRACMKAGFALVLTKDGTGFQTKATRENVKLPDDLRTVLREHKPSIMAFFGKTTPAKEVAAIVEDGDEEPIWCGRCGSWCYESIRPYGCGLQSICPFALRQVKDCEQYTHSNADGLNEKLDAYNELALQLSTKRADRQKQLAAEREAAKVKKAKGALI